MIDIKVRYYDRDGVAMNAEYSSEHLPRRGETIYLGPEGEAKSYYVHSVTHYPNGELEEDVFIVCRSRRPQSR